MPGTRVFVGGLKNPRVRERDLEKFFEGTLFLLHSFFYFVFFYLDVIADLFR